MNHGLTGDWAKLARTLTKHGWRVERRARHTLAYAPDGKTIVGISPGGGDYRAMHNTCAKLRRHGVPV